MKEGVHSATPHRESNFLLNLKSAAAVAGQGYIHALGAPPPTSKKNRDVRPRGASTAGLERTVLSESSQRDTQKRRDCLVPKLDQDVRESHRACRVSFGNFLLNLKAEYVRQHAKRRRGSRRWDRTTAMRERSIGQCLLDPGCNSQDGCGERNKRWVSYPCEAVSVGIGRPNHRRIPSCNKEVQGQVASCSTLASQSPPQWIASKNTCKSVRNQLAAYTSKTCAYRLLRRSDTRSIESGTRSGASLPILRLSYPQTRAGCMGDVGRE